MTELRSITVRLNADVDQYGRRMRQAGRDTELAFQRAQAQVARLNAETNAYGQNVEQMARRTELAFQRTRAQANRANSDLVTLNRSARDYRDLIAQSAVNMQRLDVRTQSLNSSTSRLTTLTTDLNTQLARSNNLVTNRNQLIVRQQPIIQRTTQQTQQLGRQFDRASGRVGMLVDALLLVGPALVPIGAMAVPAITGLANQAGIAAAAVGTMVLAFQGMGDAIEAVNEAGLDPSADNLIAMHEELSRLSPQARNAANQISFLRTQFLGMRDAAAAGFFPSLSRELNDSAPRLMEQMEDILFAVGIATGEQLADGMDSLASPRWREFFQFLEREAAPTMSQLAQIIGNSGHAISEMWMAFQPLNRDFGDWLVDITARWDRWAQRLDESEGFEDFVTYIRENGPQVAETLGAFGEAITDIVVAAAPLGGPVLEVLEAIADVVSAIAGSDFGTPILTGLAAMTLLRRGAQATSAVMGTQMAGSLRTLRADYRAAAASGGIFARQMGPLTQQMAAQRAQADRLKSTLRGIGAGGAAMVGLGIAASGAADGIGLTNTISLALMGTMMGPWGAAIGGAVGLLIDLSSASEDAAAAQSNARDRAAQLRQTLDVQTGAATNATREMLALELGTEGNREAADALGLSMNDLVDLTTGSGESFQEWARSVDDGSESNRGLIESVQGLRSNLGEARTQQVELAEVTSEAGSAAESAARAFDALSSAYARWNDLLTERDAESAAVRSIQDLAGALENANTPLRDLTTAGTDAFDALTATAHATIAWADTLPLVEKSAVIQNARQQVMDLAMAYGATAEQASALADSVDLSMDQVQGHTWVAQQATQALWDTFTSLPAEVQTVIRTEGIPQTSQDVEELVSRYSHIPDLRETLMVLQSAAAQAEITNVQTLLANIPRYTYADVITRYRTEGVATSRSNTRVYRTAPGGAFYEAAGGILQTTGGRTVQLFAGGGFNGADLRNAHRPHIAAAGTYRVFAEDETGGEAYIPLANDWRRPGSKYIAEQAVGILGGEVEWFDRGGLAQPQRTYVPAAPAARSPSTGADGLVAEVQGLRRDVALMREAVGRLPTAVEAGSYAGSHDGAKDAAAGRAKRTAAYRGMGGPR